MARIISFNIWSDQPRNIRWPRRRALIAEILRSQQPDSAGLQEANANMVQDLHDQMPDQGWLGVGRDDGRAEGEFNPIFYRKDRLAALEHDTFWLAAICETPGKGWDARCHRIVTWARFKDLEIGRDFFHFNTHFDHFGRRARRESAWLLLRKIHSIAGKRPVVVTGDFNCRENSRTYRILTGAQSSEESAPAEAVRDAFVEAPRPRHGPRKTWRGFRAGLGSGRIDYIFVKNRVSVTQYAVVTDRPGAAHASDHFPVAVDLDFESERAK